MTFANLHGTQCFYELRGEGDDVVVFAHGFMFDHRVYDAQVDALAPRYRCVRFDWRGQGRSAVPTDGYDLDGLAGDVEALLDHLGVSRCHYVGTSMGGRVGLRLAQRRPDCLRSLALLHTPLRPVPRAKVPSMLVLGLVVRLVGPGPLVDAMMREVLSPSYLTDPARSAERALWRERLAGRDRAGLVRTLLGVVVRGEDLTPLLDAVRVPTLVVAGRDDRGLSPEAVRDMAARIVGAAFHELPAVAHCAPIEAPEALTKLLEVHLARAAARPA